MDDCAQAAARQRKGAHASPGRARCRAPRLALGPRREVVCVRGSQRQNDACRPVRRPKSARRVPFHAGARLEGGLSELLALGGSPRWLCPAPGSEGCDARRRLSRAVRRNRTFQAAYGLAVSLGVSPWQRLQPRLRRLLLEGGGGGWEL